ncbi:MAG: PilZ domain-containing protein [Nitrospira sp.]|nr:PilZ domain-containing protein [Nitrospira sp.]
MDIVRPYHRGLYRLSVSYPAMYCLLSTIGEGVIVNLSALGCTMQTDRPMPPGRSVSLRLLLPDRHESLPIDLGQVRWVDGNRAGIEFTKVDRSANLRLHSFVWDLMVERIHCIQRERVTS